MTAERRADRQRRDVAWVDLEPGALGGGERQDRARQAGPVDGGKPGQLRVGQDVDGLGHSIGSLAAGVAVRARLGGVGSS